MEENFVVEVHGETEITPPGNLRLFFQRKRQYQGLKRCVVCEKAGEMVFAIKGKRMVMTCAGDCRMDEPVRSSSLYAEEYERLKREYLSAAARSLRDQLRVLFKYEVIPEECLVREKEEYLSKKHRFLSFEQEYKKALRGPDLTEEHKKLRAIDPCLGYVEMREIEEHLSKSRGNCLELKGFRQTILGE